MSQNAIDKGKAYAGFIPEVWSKKLSVLLDKSGVMMQCINKDYEGDIKGKGDTVHISSFGDVAVSTYTGSIASYDELTAPTQDLIIDQEKIFAFKVNDISKAQSNIDIMNGYLERAKVAVNIEKDSFLLARHADVPAENTIGTEEAPVLLTKDNAYSYFVELAKTLKNNNAGATGKTPWVVINPNLEAIVMQAPEFIHATAAADKVLRDGSIGRIAGLDVLVCTNLEETAISNGSYTGDVVYTLAGTNDAITFASQVVKIEQLRDQASFADLIRGLYVYGAKTVAPNALAKLICTTTAY